MEITPGRAIRAFCIHCIGGKDVPNARKEVRNCTAPFCPFYPFRLGKGRPRLKVIRQLCQECMSDGGGKRATAQAIAECPSTNCPVYPYRFGKNPKLAGRIPNCVKNSELAEAIATQFVRKWLTLHFVPKQ